MNESSTNKDGYDLLQLIDQAPLTGPYWRVVSILVIASIFDYFDFFLVGFLVAVVGPQWNLTYFETSILLLSAGVGAIVGAIIWGLASDILGRKLLLISSLVICGLASGSIAFVPDGNWLLFAALRFFVGIGVAGAATGSVTLAVEMTPVRARTMLTSAMVVPVSIGIFGAAILSSNMLPIVGWRGLALTGFAPLLLVPPAMLWLPESPRWLMTQDRFEKARLVAAGLYKMPLSSVPYPPKVAPPAKVRLRDLYVLPRRFWFVTLSWLGFSAATYGVILWGPTLLSLILSVSPAEAARLFIVVSLSGLAGRVIFTIMPHFTGRRFAGQVTGLGIALTLAAAALLYGEVVNEIPLLLVCLAVGALFFDGGAANMGPMPAEVFPARLAARGVGLGQAANGIGKIVGPLILALIAGSNNFVTPAATIEAAAPAFLFLAGCGLLVWIAFTFLGIETHRKSMALDD